MPTLPGPVRATLGLVVVTVENARSLPAKAIEVPVAAVSSVLQLSLRAQQRYAELTIRGDDVLARLRGVPEDAPTWATFDEPPTADTGNGRPSPSPNTTAAPTEADSAVSGAATAATPTGNRAATRPTSTRATKAAKAAPRRTTIRSSETGITTEPREPDPAADVASFAAAPDPEEHLDLPEG